MEGGNKVGISLGALCWPHPSSTPTTALYLFQTLGLDKHTYHN